VKSRVEQGLSFADEYFYTSFTGQDFFEAFTPRVSAYPEIGKFGRDQGARKI
jgi:hypothetical protein